MQEKSSCLLTPEVFCLTLVSSLYFLVFTSVKDVRAQSPITSLQEVTKIAIQYIPGSIPTICCQDCVSEMRH